MNTSKSPIDSEDLARPAKVCVVDVVASRYGAPLLSEDSASRPQSWDQRLQGIDLVRGEGGQVVKLLSSPMQSPPRAGWVIVLTGGSEASGYTWTLYGISRRH
jgi:hypothetical protein